MSLDPALYPPIPPVSGDGPRPFWSVVVPAYKAQYLAQALKSAVDQAPSPDRMEILVVDDCSPEDLLPIVRRVAGDRVKYVRQPVNLGTYANENSAISMARGQWIHILNDDDWVLPGFYEVFEKSLACAPDSVGGAFCSYINCDAAGKELSTPPPKLGAPGLLIDFIDQIGISNVVHPIAAIFRRRSFEVLGGFNLNLNYCADWEFNKRVALHFDWWYEPRVMACYRASVGNVSTQSVLTGQQLRDLRYAIELTEKLLPEESRQRITEASRAHYAQYALRVASAMMKSRQWEVAMRQIQEGLKLSRSDEILQKLIQLLSQPHAGPMRQMVANVFERIELPPLPGGNPSGG